ncbi:MAG: hypothetical protein MR775_04920 [Erysipelotrichaceae bacterium]|nr:hypothetical protein [Erysipelotrichaceae bacterium]
MQKVIIKIYIKKKVSPLATVEIEDAKKFDELFDNIENAKSVVKFGQIMFLKTEFRFATLTFK